MRGDYMGGTYMWSNTSVKERVSLSAGGLYAVGLLYAEKYAI